MILSERLKNWFTKFERYKVTYRKGFFRLSNLANSPYTIIESFDKMPFCKHFRKDKLITAKTLFLDADLYYTEIEEGLWIFVSELYYKKNLEMTNIYDKLLPVDFNFINLHYHSTTIKSKSMVINGRILTDKTWTVFKAGNATSDCHFKDALENNITIYFTNDWLEKQVKPGGLFADSSLNKFFKSLNTYIILQDEDKDSDGLYNEFLELARRKDNYKMKESIIDFFNKFISKYDKEAFTDGHFKLTDTDRKYIQKTEKYLFDNLLQTFPGVENIADKIGVSPTKVKNDFKVVHDKSLYHYYRYHKMNLANELLSSKDFTVKEVSNILGYENASKFAAVFKEQFGVQPSTLKSGTNSVDHYVEAE